MLCIEGGDDHYLSMSIHLSIKSGHIFLVVGVLPGGTSHHNSVLQVISMYLSYSDEFQRQLSPRFLFSALPR